MTKRTPETEYEKTDSYSKGIYEKYNVYDTLNSIPKEFKCFWEWENGCHIREVLSYPLWDHVRILRPKKIAYNLENTLLIQSYHCNEEQILHLINICKSNNLKFTIFQYNIHHERCFGIMITKKR